MWIYVEKGCDQFINVIMKIIDHDHIGDDHDDNGNDHDGCDNDNF